MIQIRVWLENIPGNRYITNKNSVLQLSAIRVCNTLAKLWTAPEILRMNFPLERGTPKGDVYSFAIVAYEIMVRSEPYPFDTMTPRGNVSENRH